VNFLFWVVEKKLCRWRRSREQVKGSEDAAGLRLLAAEGKRYLPPENREGDNQDGQRCGCRELANCTVLDFVSGGVRVDVHGLCGGGEENQQHSEKDQALRKA
jgi:hypothetical protein